VASLLNNDLTDSTPPDVLDPVGLGMWPDLSLVRMMALSVHSFVLTLKVE
jgi:hypothetical protein